MSGAIDPSRIHLFDFPSLERAAHERTLHLVLAFWRERLPASRTGAEDRALGAVFAALRIQLSLLVREPDLIFPCLYNSLAYYDDPSAELSYGRPAPTEPPVLRRLLDAWWSERRSRGGGRPWARALRPPAFHLDGPLLEEHREELGGGHLRFSDDDSAIGILGPASSVAWDRSSGARLGESKIRRRFSPLVPPRFELVRAADWGRLIAHDRLSGPAVDLDLDGDSSIGVLAELPCGALIAAGWKEDYDGVIFRVDPPYTSVRWAVMTDGVVDTLSVSPGGDAIAAGSRRAVVVLDAATGRARRRLPARDPQVALSSDGRLLATREGDVLRVWCLNTDEPIWPLRGCRGGWIDARFSPDGRYLLTGELLSDAQTGREIAQLDLDGPGYLEGGPPLTGRLLANGRFVETAPLRGVRVWDTEMGRLLVSDPTRRHGSWDIVVIAPDGLLYALVSGGAIRPASSIDLVGTDDGKVLRSLPMEAPEVLVFSPDGARLCAASQTGELSVFRIPEGDIVFRAQAHAGQIRDVWLSLDGARVATAEEGGLLRLWSMSGQMLGERLISGDADAHLEGWLGFSRRSHPFVARAARGLTEIVNVQEDTVRAIAALSADLVADPTGAIWASREAHVRIEEC